MEPGSPGLEVDIGVDTVSESPNISVRISFRISSHFSILSRIVKSPSVNSPSLCARRWQRVSRGVVGFMSSFSFTSVHLTLEYIDLMES